MKLQAINLRDLIAAYLAIADEHGVADNTMRAAFRKALMR